MNNQPDSTQLMLHIMGVLSASETESLTHKISEQPNLQEKDASLRQFAGDIQQLWIQHHVEKLLKIIDQGEQVLEVPQEISSQTIHENVKKLINHFAEMDSQALRQRIHDSVKQIWHTFSPSNPSPAWAMRGHTSTLLELPIPSTYGFAARLVLGGFNDKAHFVRGRVKALPPNDQYMLDHLQGAQAWLLPKEGGNWHKATVDEFGAFEFPKVPPGDYDFEMAWSGHFLEILSVQFPAPN